MDKLDSDDYGVRAVRATTRPPKDEANKSVSFEQPDLVEARISKKKGLEDLTKQVAVLTICMRGIQESLSNRRSRQRSVSPKSNKGGIMLPMWRKRKFHLRLS